MEELQQQLPDETLAMESEPTEGLGSDDASIPAPTAPVVDPVYDRRRQRIQDYRAEALEDPNPLRACLGAANSDLFDCQLQVSESFRRVIATGPQSMDDVETYAELIQLDLRVTKQIVQVTQFDLNMQKREDLEAAARKQLNDEANKSPDCAPPE